MKKNNYFIINPKLIQLGLSNNNEEIFLRETSLYNFLYKILINKDLSYIKYIKYSNNELEDFIENFRNKISKKKSVKCYLNECGQIILVDGWYRIIIAHLLNIEEIVIQIINSNDTWNNFVTNLKKEKVFYPIEHPSFYDKKKLNREDFKINAIKLFINPEYVSVLDLNPNWGYNATILQTEKGIKSILVEKDINKIKILEKIKTANCLNFDIVNKIEDVKEKIDIVLALNCFNSEFVDKINLIKKLNPKLIFIESEFLNDRNIINKNFKKYPIIEEIGYSAVNNKIYKIEKERKINT